MQHRVFLSASIPPPNISELRSRPDAWDDLYAGFPTQPGEVERAIRALVPHVFKHEELVLVFGGHPAITPIVADIARRRRGGVAVEIYQSAFFAGQEPFSHQADKYLYQNIHWTPICEPPIAHPVPLSKPMAPGEYPLDEGSQAAREHTAAVQKLRNLGEPDQAAWRQASLTCMRNKMISNCIGGIFVGGMQGVEDELRLFEQANPKKPAWLVTRPGGRTARIAVERTAEHTPYRHVENDFAYETVGENIANELMSNRQP